jgi:hypothetical protein
MNRNLVIVCLTALVCVVVVLAFVSVGTASPPEVQQSAGAPTMVSYQGQVTVAGVAYTGTGYFKFAIWSGSGGNEWTNDGTASGGGEPTAAVSLTVDSGLFNVLLGDTSLTNMTALEASVFDEPERYLRIWFSNDDSTYTLLSPDQRIAAVPYALQAEKTKGYANVVVVAKSGGDYLTISEALNSITTASDSNRYLIKVMPGVYTELVEMKEYVDIEGSGELNTIITYTGSSTFQATLEGADNAELRTLTVENTGTKPYAVAIYNNSASPRLTQVTAIASGGTTESYGVRNDYSSSPVMTDVSASAGGSGTNCYGVYNYLSSPHMTNVRAKASGGTSTNYGVSNSYSSPHMTNVSASAGGGTYSHGVFNGNSSPVMTDVSASAGGGISNHGVHNAGNSSPVMTDVSASASGGLESYGVYNWASSTTIRNSVISASGATNINVGIYNSATSSGYTLIVDSSQITASTNTIYNGGTHTILIGASLLSGGNMTGGGMITCAGVYDENYTFYASTCP